MRLNRRQFRLKIRRRGASLVEAVAVIPIFILFFVGMIYVHKIYAKKMDAQRLARSETMAYALGGCQGDYATVVHSTQGSQTNAPPSGVPDPNGIHPQGGQAQNMDNHANYGVATLRHTSTKVQGTVDMGHDLQSANKTMSSSSVAMCGDKPVDGNLKGLINYAIHLFVQ
jgi:hypothetical protein